MGTGSIAFDSAGRTAATAQTVTLTPAGGAATPQATSVRFDGITQLAEASQLALSSQDGLEPGSFTGFTVTDSGIIMGSYNNGLTRPLGQLAIAAFANPAGLSREGDGTYSESANSGVSQVGVAGSQGRGAIAAESLEMSNVDLTSEFANLIVLQRGFQANGRSITVSDQLLEDVLQLKR